MHRSTAVLLPSTPLPATMLPATMLPATQLPATLLLATMLLATMLLTPCSLSASEPPDTLIELVRSALASDEGMARADSQVRRSEADIKLSSSVLLPRFDINGNYTRYQEEQVLELTPGESFVLRPSSDWSWSADIRQTLFYGLRDWRARDAALLYRDIAQLERETTAANLVLRVAGAFFETVAAKQRLEVARIALEQIAEQQRVAERRYEVGEAVKADVARWRAEVAAQRQAVVVAEGATELARRRLARLAGVDSVGKLEVPGPVPVADGDDSELVTLALGQRLEMATVHHQLEAAGIIVKIEKGARLPELEANAQYFKQKAQFPSSDWLSLTLSLKVPIYDGGLATARTAKAREDLLEVQLVERETRKWITDQVEEAAISYRSATATLAAAREREDAAVEAHHQVERAYRVGEASATDLLTTTTALTDARTSQIIARAQRQLQAIALRHAVGQPPLPDLVIPLTKHSSGRLP